MTKKALANDNHYFIMLHHLLDKLNETHHNVTNRVNTDNNYNNDDKSLAYLS